MLFTPVFSWLERNSLTRLGISPKEYIQLQRFLYAYLNFTTPTNEDLTEIALKSGKYDYKHFLKGFLYRKNPSHLYKQTYILAKSVASISRENTF